MSRATTTEEVKRLTQWSKRGLLIIAVTGVMAGLAGCGPEKYEAKTGGSEEMQQKVKEGQPLYTPPKEALPPGAKPMTLPTPPPR